MTLWGWVFMLISWAVIVGVLVFCLIRTLRPGANNTVPDEPESAASPEAPPPPSGR